jgi:hypothetical protein
MGDDSRHNEGGWCDDCHDYTHMPWCPSYEPQRQDPPLVQLPLEHAALRSPKQAHDDAYARGYQDGWADANLMRLRAENDYLRTMRGMVAGWLRGGYKDER